MWLLSQMHVFFYSFNNLYSQTRRLNIKTDTDTFFTCYHVIMQNKDSLWYDLNKGRKLSEKMQIFEKHIVVYLAKLGKICKSTVSNESHKLIWGKISCSIQSQICMSFISFGISGKYDFEHKQGSSTKGEQWSKWIQIYQTCTGLKNLVVLLTTQAHISDLKSWGWVYRM